MGQRSYCGTKFFRNWLAETKKILYLSLYDTMGLAPLHGTNRCEIFPPPAANKNGRQAGSVRATAKTSKRAVRNVTRRKRGRERTAKMVLSFLLSCFRKKR